MLTSRSSAGGRSPGSSRVPTVLAKKSAWVTAVVIGNAGWAKW